MRIGLISDIHANLEALEAVLKALSAEAVDQTFCLGDLVGYGPDPNLCIEKTIESVNLVVAGNHDHAAVGLVSTAPFNEHARAAIEWTKKVISDEYAEYLKNLPLMQCKENITAVHASPECPDQWRYVIGEDDAYRNLMGLTTNLCFVGHTHMPLGYMMDTENNLYFQQDLTAAEIESNRKYLINVGSVGQPRDGDTRACLGILDTEKGLFELKRVKYDFKVTQEKMVQKKLPEFLIERLSWGR